MAGWTPDVRRWRVSLWARLALMYVAVTVVAFLGLDLVGRVYDRVALRRSLQAGVLADWAEGAARDLAAAGTATLRPEQRLVWMARLREQLSGRRAGIYGPVGIDSRTRPDDTFSLLLLDADRRLLVSDVGPSPGEAELTTTEQRLAAQAVSTGSTSIAEDAPGRASVVTPVVQGSRTTGLLVVRAHIPPLPWSYWRGEIADYFAGTAGALVLFGTIGLGFGALTAWRLTRRLSRIGAVTEQWSRGEFDAKAEDDASDEIGALAQRLNTMSRDLQGVMRMRQDLAGLQERHRLARDLHDAVKQQVFALALQIATARATLRPAPDEASRRLDEADRIVTDVQQELMRLIQELRPASSDGESATQSIARVADDWSRRHDVAMTVHGEWPPTLSDRAVEAFVKIAQEALGNVARHSGASAVRVHLSATPTHVGLDVSDNGCGIVATGGEGTPGIGRGMGLRNMAERARSLPGGSFEVGPGPDGGTRVSVRCRLTQEG